LPTGPASARLHVEWLRYAATVFKRLASEGATYSEKDMTDPAQQQYTLINKSLYSLLTTLSNFEHWACENKFDDGGRERVRAAEPPALPDPPLTDNALPATFREEVDIKV